MDTVEELGGTYFFDGMINLDKLELLYWIFIDEADKQLGGVKDILALAAMIGGLPIIPVKGKLDTGRATSGTSPISKASRTLIKHRFKERKKTLTWNNMLQGKWTYTKSLGAFVGRWIPVLGVTILAYDITMITTNAIRRYNLIVKPEDKI